MDHCPDPDTHFGHADPKKWVKKMGQKMGHKPHSTKHVYWK